LTTPRQRRSGPSPLFWALVIIGVIALVVVFQGSRGRETGGGSAGTATPRPTQAAAVPSDASPTPTPLVVPTPAIPLPRSCPPNTAAQVDNPGLYGFCTPLGWGAYNNNNSLPITLLMKPRPGGNQVLQPTDFDRIQLLVALNAPQPQNVPGDCNTAANDSIDGLATHHCATAIDPSANPYKAVRAEFWAIDLFQDKKFYITALIGDDVSPQDVDLMNQVVHAVKPPTNG
jgi:hypothetical protein